MAFVCLLSGSVLKEVFFKVAYKCWEEVCKTVSEKLGEDIVNSYKLGYVINLNFITCYHGTKSENILHAGNPQYTCENIYIQAVHVRP